MLYCLDWPELSVQSLSLYQRILNNTNLLSNQHGYNPQQRYAGLWHWPEQAQDAADIYSQLGLTLPIERLHLQWVKPPGIGFHRDQNRHLSATCVLTAPHPTFFRSEGQEHKITMQTGRWYLFDHWVEHAVLDVAEDRFAVCIDFTGLYANFTDLCTAATAGSLRSCLQDVPPL